MSKERDFGVDGEPEHAHGISHGPRFHGESPVVHVIITLGTLAWCNLTNHTMCKGVDHVHDTTSPAGVTCMSVRFEFV